MIWQNLDLFININEMLRLKELYMVEYPKNSRISQSLCLLEELGVMF